MSRHDRLRVRMLSVLLVLGAAGVEARAATQLTASYVANGGREIGLLFDRGDETLRAQAVLTLQADNRTIEILLTNTTVGIPDVGAFDNPSDQILTSLYFDLGGPGLNPADPAIVGGQAFVGAGSVGVGNGNDLVAGQEISNLWGFTNFKYTEAGMEFLPPNIVTVLTAHADAFTGGNLEGPGYGAISALNLLDAHNAGLPSISDTVALFVQLDQDVESLASIVAAGNYVPYVEFGSDAHFFVADDPPSPPPAVPEPLTLLSLGGAVAALGCYLRRRLHAVHRELRAKVRPSLPADVHQTT